MIIKINDYKYIIKNKGLYVGEGTESEHLWNDGFKFHRVNFLGIGFVVAEKFHLRPLTKEAKRHMREVERLKGKPNVTRSKAN